MLILAALASSRRFLLAVVAISAAAGVIALGTYALVLEGDERTNLTQAQAVGLAFEQLELREGRLTICRFVAFHQNNSTWIVKCSQRDAEGSSEFSEWHISDVTGQITRQE
jgi:hypothetical protein